MNFRTLFLGSAAAVIVAGGASAADLTVAEPVDYVKVCDAFGAGFFYSPGTDTCIKIGGYVKFGTNVNNNNFVNESNGTHYGQFYTEASIQLTASSVTEYGNLTGWIDLRANTGSSYDYAAAGDTFGHIDSAYLQLGPLKAGHFTSAFDSLGGYTDFGAFRADQSTDHVQLTYAMGGFGLIASVEDGSDRLAPQYGSDSSSGVVGVGPYYLYNYYYKNPKNIPDFVAAATYAAGPISAKLSGAFVNDGSVSNRYNVYQGGSGNYTYDPAVYDSFGKANHGYAVQLSVEVALDNISKGDKFGIQGVYANDAPAYTGWQKFFGASTAEWDGSIYGGFASYIHYWNPSLWTAAEVSYLKSDKYDTDLWQVSASTDWSPVKNLDLMLDGSYAKANYNGYGDDHQWSINLWMKRSW